MFKRWLRRARDERLDLPRHRPSDFEGKIVVLNEREYVVGANLRTSDQGYVHRLTKRRSGLCMHVIQIRPEYQRDPDAAWALSGEKQAPTAQLRDSLLADGSVDQIPVITARKACSGSFELHEMSGVLGDETPMSAGEDISAANAMEKDRDYRGAISLLKRVVAEYPDHTMALRNLAHCHCQCGEYVEALAPIAEAKLRE